LKAGAFKDPPPGIAVMFDLSWGEMGIIAVVALVVLGPKELPNALRTMSMLMKNARKLAGEFQSGVNEIIREADLEEARKKLNEVGSLNKNQIQNAIEKTIDPTGEVKSALAEANRADPTGPAKPVEAQADPGFAIPTVAASTEDAAVEIAAATGEAPTLPPSATPEAESPDHTPSPEPAEAAKG
jgi:sec-independent protein translocase protein TatB